MMSIKSSSIMDRSGFTQRGCVTGVSAHGEAASSVKVRTGEPTSGENIATTISFFGRGGQKIVHIEMNT